MPNKVRRPENKYIATKLRHSAVLQNKFRHLDSLIIKDAVKQENKTSNILCITKLQAIV